MPAADDTPLRRRLRALDAKHSAACAEEAAQFRLRERDMARARENALQAARRRGARLTERLLDAVCRAYLARCVRLR